MPTRNEPNTRSTKPDTGLRLSLLPNEDHVAQCWPSQGCEFTLPHFDGYLEKRKKLWKTFDRDSRKGMNFLIINRSIFHARPFCFQKAPKKMVWGNDDVIAYAFEKLFQSLKQFLEYGGVLTVWNPDRQYLTGAHAKMLSRQADIDLEKIHELNKLCAVPRSPRRRETMYGAITKRVFRRETNLLLQSWCIITRTSTQERRKRCKNEKMIAMIWA
jgi:hypothetical protein